MQLFLWQTLDTRTDCKMHLQDDRNELLDVCQSNPDMLWIAKVSSGAKGRLVIHQFIFIQSVFSHAMVLSQNERNVFV